MIVEFPSKSLNYVEFDIIKCAVHGIYLVGESLYMRRYRQSVRKAQSINSDIWVKGSVEQNRGSTNDT